MASFRRVYGASPLHLLALLASFALAGYAALSWFQLGAASILRWFVILLIGHELVLVPLCTLLDWVALGGERGRARAARAPVNAVPYIRVPAVLSGLLAVVFAPEILSLANPGQNVYLGRWLAATGIMFALSALAFALAVRRARAGAPGKPSHLARSHDGAPPLVERR